MSKRIKKKNLKFGKEDFFENDDFHPKNVKHRISIMVPEDILLSYKDLAVDRGLPYQTLMNQVLRDYISGHESFEERISRLEEEVLKKKHR